MAGNSHSDAEGKSENWAQGAAKEQILAEPVRKAKEEESGMGEKCLKEPGNRADRVGHSEKSRTAGTRSF